VFPAGAAQRGRRNRLPVVVFLSAQAETPGSFCETDHAIAWRGDWSPGSPVGPRQVAAAWQQEAWANLPARVAGRRFRRCGHGWRSAWDGQRRDCSVRALAWPRSLWVTWFGAGFGAEPERHNRNARAAAARPTRRKNHGMNRLDPIPPAAPLNRIVVVACARSAAFAQQRTCGAGVGATGVVPYPTVAAVVGTSATGVGWLGGPPTCGRLPRRGKNSSHRPRTAPSAVCHPMFVTADLDRPGIERFASMREFSRALEAATFGRGRRCHTDAVALVRRPGQPSVRQQRRLRQHPRRSPLLRRMPRNARKPDDDAIEVLRDRIKPIHAMVAATRRAAACSGVPVVAFGLRPKDQHQPRSPTISPSQRPRTDSHARCPSSYLRHPLAATSEPAPMPPARGGLPKPPAARRPQPALAPTGEPGSQSPRQAMA